MCTQAEICIDVGCDPQFVGELLQRLDNPGPLPPPGCLSANPPNPSDPSGKSGATPSEPNPKKKAKAAKQPKQAKQASLAGSTSHGLQCFHLSP